MIGVPSKETGILVGGVFRGAYGYEVEGGVPDVDIRDLFDDSAC